MCKFVNEGIRKKTIFKREFCVPVWILLRILYRSLFGTLPNINDEIFCKYDHHESHLVILCENMVFVVIQTSSFYNVSFFVALITLWYYWSILKKLDHEMKVSTLSSRIWYVKDSSFHTHCIEYSKILQNTLQNMVLIRRNTGQWKPLFSHILCSHIYLQNALAYA